MHFLCFIADQRCLRKSVQLHLLRPANCDRRGFLTEINFQLFAFFLLVFFHQWKSSIFEIWLISVPICCSYEEMKNVQRVLPKPVQKMLPAAPLIPCVEVYIRILRCYRGCILPPGPLIAFLYQNALREKETKGKEMATFVLPTSRHTVSTCWYNNAVSFRPQLLQETFLPSLTTYGRSKIVLKRKFSCKIYCESNSVSKTSWL